MKTREGEIAHITGTGINLYLGASVYEAKSIWDDGLRTAPIGIVIMDAALPNMPRDAFPDPHGGFKLASLIRKMESHMRTSQPTFLAGCVSEADRQQRPNFYDHMKLGIVNYIITKPIGWEEHILPMFKVYAAWKKNFARTP
jgi:hypothetical protein